MFITFGGQSIFPLLRGEKQGSEDGRCQSLSMVQRVMDIFLLFDHHSCCMHRKYPKKVFSEDKDVVGSPMYSTVQLVCSPLGALQPQSC